MKPRVVSLFLSAALACVPPAIAAESDAAQAPNPMLTARVMVVNSDGDPVAGATVAPWAIRSDLGHGSWAPDGQGRSKPPVVQTDERGLAEFEYPKYAAPSRQIPCLQLSCRVEHPDYADTVYNEVPVPQTDGPERIELARGAEVRIAPLDENLEPVTDGVHAMWCDNSYWSSSARARTDGEAIVLPRLTAGAELVRLVRIEGDQATHFSPPLPFLLADGQAVELMESLQPAASVQGRLSDNVPRPVKNGRVAVVVAAKAPGENWETLYWNDWAPVAEDGTFTLTGLPPGEPLQLIGLCDGFIAASGDAPEFADDNERDLRERRLEARGLADFHLPQVFDLPQEGEAELTVAMKPTGRCEVRVLDAAGAPLAGLQAETWPNVKWWNGGSQIYCSPLRRTAALIDQINEAAWSHDDGAERYGRLFSGVTDEDGRVTLTGLPLGGHNFIVTEPRGGVHRFEQHEGKLTASAEGTSVEVTMEPLP
ncbi:hypothetical protein KOR34_34880 [Posidoniimonas corsicana]|uniref:Nickel uptake substrate-specific transmembrane region n=1 Tax=Posidoniimonas corsicana TaxID=1938618 RepID=A0A5C5V7C9_9BACT|nr:hypothetical protein [Posidoniimonas corsicana]TWT33655.1 hypothetical protein KOR34_34880 [Posidoniimonas corsicana]